MDSIPYKVESFINQLLTHQWSRKGSSSGVVMHTRGPRHQHGPIVTVYSLRKKKTKLVACWIPSMGRGGRKRNTIGYRCGLGFRAGKDRVVEKHNKNHPPANLKP